MVNKITGKRLKNLIVYDGIKIVALSVIVCLIAVLVFNAFAKKPSAGQDFRLIVDEDVFVGDDANEFLDYMFYSGAENGGFSYETLQGQLVYLRSNDESPKSYVLSGVHVELHEDDVCVLLEGIYVDYISQNNAVKIDEYLNSAKQFLLDNGLCDENGVFNVDKVNAYFESTRGKDSRFKTADQIEVGKANELKRLKAIWNNATALQNCFALHKELLDEREYTYGNFTDKGYFALNVGALNGNSQTGKYVENLFKRAYQDENNETVYTADGIYIALGKNLDANGDLFYENLAFLYTLIKTYSTYI